MLHCLSHRRSERPGAVSEDGATNSTENLLTVVTIGIATSEAFLPRRQLKRRG